MRQGKLNRCLWILLVMLCLAGCGKKENKEAEEEPETVLSAAVQYILSGLSENGNDSMLLGGTLYYSDRLGDDGGEEWIEAVYRKTGEQEASIQEIDMQTGALFPKEELPFQPEEIVAVLSGFDEGVFVNTDKSLYSFKPSGGAERLLDWEDFFLKGYNVLQACIDGDGFQLFIRKNNVLSQMRIEDTAPEESGKQKVSIGVLSVLAKGIIGELVAAFNAASPDYQVEMVEYEYNPADNFNEVYRQLLKGEGPDLFELYSLRLPVDVLADKGALEDLVPYLEESEAMGMEDILPCVIEAGSHQGRLVGLCPLFTIGALAVEQGHAAGCGWTPEEFLAYAAEHPNSALYKNGTSCGTLLENLMVGDMGEYIDWEEKKCSFNTEGFIGLLACAYRCV